MRFLQLALILSISLTLIAYNSDAVARAKSGKSGSQSSHSRSKGKKSQAKASSGDVWVRIRQGIRIPRPNPASSEFGEIPVATVSTSKNAYHSSTLTTKSKDAIRAADELMRLTTVITPKKDSNENKLEENSEKKYTPLGRLRFAKKETVATTEDLSKKLHIIPNEQPSSARADAFKSPTVQRIRTRLNLHPELFKDGVVPGEKTAMKKSLPGKNWVAQEQNSTQEQSVIKNCADLKKEDVINLAKQGILSDRYSEMAEVCRIKQTEKIERINKHIAGYSQRKGLLHHVSEQARPYLYHIVDALSKYGMPLDLALLPIVESAYEPTALSPKSAAGLWQFIPSTGVEFGLEQTNDYDARLDVTASTHAAIRFLSGLNAHYKGDWLLALAAYNCGQGTVDAAISHNQAEGLDTDYWSLNLPAETQDYVPRLLALAAIFANPGGYGINLRPIKNEPYFIKVTIDRDEDIKQLAFKDLKTIAKLADFDPDQFQLLNSAYLKSTITQNKPFTLLMPISNANLLHRSLAFMAQSSKEEKQLTALFLTDTPPDTSSIETKTQAPLLSLNVAETWPLLAATSPTQVQSKSVEKKTVVTTKKAYLSVYYLEKGETLKTVADYHGISEAELRELNKLKKRQTASLGQRLLVPLKQIVTDMALKKSHPSILYKGLDFGLNSLNFRL